jgi:hypothetical protein
MTPPPTGPASAGCPVAERTTWAQRMCRRQANTDQRAATDACPGPRNWMPARAGTPRAQLTHLPDTEGSQDLTL